VHLAQLQAWSLLLLGTCLRVGEGEGQAVSRGGEAVGGGEGQVAGQVGGVGAEVAHQMVMEHQGLMRTSRRGAGSAWRVLKRPHFLPM
jgi:hypothetical protein